MKPKSDFFYANSFHGAIPFAKINAPTKLKSGNQVAAIFPTRVK
jgi:hypothetical protein